MGHPVYTIFLQDNVADHLWGSVDSLIRLYTLRTESILTLPNCKHRRCKTRSSASSRCHHDGHLCGKLGMKQKKTANNGDLLILTCLTSTRFRPHSTTFVAISSVSNNRLPKMSTIITENEQELAHELGRLIEKASNEAINHHNQFYIGVSGGSLITFLANGLKGINTDLSKWVIFFNDERVVPIDDPDSTFGAYKKDIVGKVPLKEEQFVQIKQGVSAEVAAKDYTQKMALYFTEAWPVFDMLLLGMGPDGHTCSLFPGHPLLEDDSTWVAPITDSPKPPLERVTITFPVINNAKACVFAMAGDGKADMLKRVLIDKEDFPVNRVKPKSGIVHWIVDKAAGKYLKN